MPKVLLQLAIVIAAAGVLPVGRSSAQGYRNRQPAYQLAQYNESFGESIPPGRTVESSNNGWSDEQPSLLGNSGDFFEYGQPQCPANCDSLDDGEALIPDGFWNNRGPLWYGSASVTLLQKSAGTHGATQLPVATLLQEALVLGQVVVIRPVIMGTAGLDDKFTPGLRLTVGRNLFEDILQRQHAVEFSFIGLNHWQNSGFAEGRPGSQTSTSITFANLWSFFPINNPKFNAFNNASLMTMGENSAFNNYEFNYRLTKLPRPDRIAQQPDGSWMQVGTPCLTHSLLAGIRVVTFDDNFHWTSFNTAGASGTATGAYNVKTSNTLLGAQGGGDLFMNFNVWTLGVRGKAGVYHNFASQNSDVTIIDPVQGNSFGQGAGSVGTTAFVGDVGLISTTRIAERAYFRFSYDFLWVGGLANAPEQLQYTTQISSVVRKNGFLCFQGLSFGFDFCW